MNASKNIFSALSDETAPKTTQTGPKKKGKKKSVPLSLHEPPAVVVAQSAPRHPLRTEMTEDEELRLALEESKREADRIAKSANLVTPAAWSSVARPAASTVSPVAPATQVSNTAVTKPKLAVGPPQNANTTKNAAIPVSTSSTSVSTKSTPGNASQTSHAPTALAQGSLPAAPSTRSATNPWTSLSASHVKSTDSSPAPSQSTLSTSPVSTASSLTTLTIDDQDELDPVLLSTRPTASPTPHIKPISRPTSTDSPYLSNHSDFSTHSSALDDDTDTSLHFPPRDFHSPPIVLSALPHMDLLSPHTTTQPSNITQLQETLQVALNRISQLEQTNELIMARMSRIVEASVHLEQTVTATVAENTLLKSQMSELRSSFLRSQNTSQSNPELSSSLFSAQNGFGGYFQPQSYNPTQRNQNNQIGLGLPSSIYSAAVNHTQASNELSSNLGGNQGLNSAGFASNGYLN